jgi:peptide/nickel transport system permease protein
MKQESLPRAWRADSANSVLQRFLNACQVIARNRMALFGAVIVGTWLVTALAAPLMATHDPYEIDIAQRLKGPSAAHWLGTDFLGRDTYSRIVFGARTAFQVAIGAVFLGAVFGIPIGAMRRALARRPEATA